MIATDPARPERVSRRRPAQIAVFAALLIAATLPGGSPDASAATTGESRTAVRPNVVLIVVDDLGYGDLGIHGSTEIRTPHIDALAARGTRFPQAYVSSSLCAPSRAGILTGRDGNRYGYTDNLGTYVTQLRFDMGVPREEILLSEYLSRAGYATGVFGKWHLGAQPRYRPGRRGFDQFFGVLTGAHDYLDWKDEVFGPVFRNAEELEGKGYLTTALSDEALVFLRTAARDRKTRPFFLYLSYTAVHTPLTATAELLERNAHIADPVRRTMAAMVTSVDDGIGRIEAALRKAGALDDTLVIFLSDNGGNPDFADNGALSSGKGSLSEGGIRVPFLMAWPRGMNSAPPVYDAVVSSLDIVPTVLAAAAISPEAVAFDGVDLGPYLRGQLPGAPHARLGWRLRGQSALRSGTLKLLRNDAGEQLFDLADDPGEARDLATTRPLDRARLAGELDAWLGTLGPAEPSWQRRKK